MYLRGDIPILLPAVFGNCGYTGTVLNAPAVVNKNKNSY